MEPQPLALDKEFQALLSDPDIRRQLRRTLKGFGLYFAHHLYLPPGDHHDQMIQALEDGDTVILLQKLVVLQLELDIGDVRAALQPAAVAITKLLLHWQTVGHMVLSDQQLPSKVGSSKAARHDPMNALSKNLVCILTKSGVEIWAEADRIEPFKQKLVDLRSHFFVEYDGEVINTARRSRAFTKRIRWTR
jgi:hypothetical protein